MQTINIKYTFMSTGDYENGGSGEERRIKLPFTGRTAHDGEAFGRWYKGRYGDVLFEQYDPAFERAARYYQHRTACSDTRRDLYQESAEQGYRNG